MKLRSILCSSVATAILATGAVATGFAQHAGHESHHGTKAEAASAAGILVEVTDKEAAWAAEARKGYPLKVCVASGEELGSMGDPAEFIYRVKGQPDRLVIFCCAGCEEDFLAAPAKHLAKLDAAAEGKAGQAEKAGGHTGHHE